MRLLKLPDAPEPIVEEGYRQVRGSLLFGNAEFVKFRRESPYSSLQVGPRTIIVNFEAKDRKIIERMEALQHKYDSFDYVGVYLPKMDLFVDGYIFFGSFPIQRLDTDGNWLLSIDYFEEIMSHRQHYRYKHFPASVRRFDFTTTSDFLRQIADPQIAHVVVDPQTAQLLSDDFELYQKKSIVQPAQAKQVGLILEMLMGTHGVLIFTDMALPRNMQWVNENPGSDSARPQFIVVQPDQLQPFSYDTL